MTFVKRLIRLTAITGSVLVAVPTATLAATYYVSPSGSDSNSGTAPSTSWRTLTKVNATRLAPGDHLLFQGGQTFTGELDPNGSGVSGNPTVYSSYGTGQATINGAPATYPTGVSYVTYQNLILDGAHAGDCVADFSGAAATNITFDTVEVRNCADGFNQGRASDANWTIENSYIHDTSDSGIIVTGPDHTPNGGGFVIKNNRIEHTGTQNPLRVGFDSHGIYADSPGIQIIGNDIGFFQTNGVSLRMRNATVSGNTIHDGTRTSCCSSGIGYYNYDPTETPGQGTSTVSGNQISNVPYGILLDGGRYGSAISAGPESWRIDGNTFTGGQGGNGSSATGIDYRSGSTGTLLSITNNVFAGSFSNGGLDLGRTPPSYTEDFNTWTSAGGPGAGDKSPHDSTNTPPPVSTPPAHPARTVAHAANTRRVGHQRHRARHHRRSRSKQLKHHKHHEHRKHPKQHKHPKHLSRKHVHKHSLTAPAAAKRD